MKKLTVLLGMVLLLGGCAVNEPFAGDGILGRWQSVAVLKERISFDLNGEGRAWIMDDEEQYRGFDFDWDYDFDSKEYIIRAGKEYRARLTEKNNIQILEWNDRRFVREKDWTGMHSEYLRELSREIAAKTPEKERMDALVAEYAALFADTVPIEMGAEYETNIF